MKLCWYETAHIAPPIGLVVLGWWDEFSISTVVRSFNTRWRYPGWESEVRNAPLFWAELPESPIHPTPIHPAP